MIKIETSIIFVCTSVQWRAINQGSYYNKEWGNIVCQLIEDRMDLIGKIGRIDALGSVKIAKQKFNTDEERIYPLVIQWVDMELGI